jgi:hypothetical protein
VAHNRYRCDEWIRTHQWRLSFSRAETVLLNSWTPLQQTVYHIIRFIVHESGISEVHDNQGHQILSRYVIKTLMMWTCERKPSGWWKQSTVVQLTRDVMQLLLTCCKNSHCAGYFVTEANLFECNVLRTVISQVRLFTDVTYLTRMANR